MWVGWACCARRVVRQNVKAPRRLFSTQAPQADLLSKTTRNIGIVAHIDAVSDANLYLYGLLLNSKQGKTTTTERMLYYSGYTRRIGGTYILATWYRKY